MEGLLGAVVLFAIIFGIQWLWRRAKQNVLRRGAYQRSESAVHTTLVLRIPEADPAAALRGVLGRLNLDQVTKGGLAAVSAGLGGAKFTREAGWSGGDWDAELAFAPDGTASHGVYQVTRWRHKDGFALHVPEMQALMAQIEGAARAMGGSATTGSNQ